MAYLFPIADLLGTDPVSLVVLCTLSVVCAFYMRSLTGNTWTSALYFPVLLAGGLFADDAAVALGIYPPLPDNPAAVSDALPSVLIASVIGMTIAGLALLLLLRKFD